MKSKKSSFCYAELSSLERANMKLRGSFNKRMFFIKKLILRIKGLSGTKILCIFTILSLILLTVANLLVFFNKKTQNVNYYMLLNNEDSYSGSSYNNLMTFEPLDERHFILSRMSEIASSKVSQESLEDIYNESVILEDKYGIPKELILSIISVESQFFVKAYNLGSKATGLMQICEPALNDYNLRNGTNLKMKDMYNIQNNMDVGTWNIKQQMTYLKSDNIRDIVIAYNTGIGDFKKFRDYWYKGINVKDNKEYTYYENVKNNLESLINLPRNS